MDVIGGGVLVAVAATLWIAYLLPSWLRRKQYLATERNAVRLQQTLRILAETAETPEAVRVEATAREVAVQQRILHEHEELARLEAEAAANLAIAERIAAEEAADAARALALQAMATHPIATVAAPAARSAEPVAVQAVPDAAALVPVRARTARSLRRSRALCSLLVLGSLLVVIGGLVAAAFGASLLIAAAGGAGVITGFTGIVVLARRRPAPVVAAAPARPEVQPFEPIDVEATPEAEAGWTPQPLPKPLHLSRGTIAATAMASIVAAEELKRVAAEAEIAARAEQRESPVPLLRPQAAPAASADHPAEPTSDVARATGTEAASRYAGMGVVGDARPGIDDLDAVFRRRRAAV
jgi:hypothetical protein